MSDPLPFIRNSYDTQADAAVDAHVQLIIGNVGGTNTLLFTTVAGTLSAIVTANTAALVTDSSGVPAWVTGGTANRVLRTNGTALSFAQVALTTDVTGTLPVANGGTGASSFGGTNTILFTTSASTLSSITTANTSALVTNSAGVPAFTSGGTANRVLRTDGTTVSFAQVALGTDVTGTLAATLGGTGQSTVTTGDLIYGSSANVWSKLAGVATGNALISGGIGTAPSWGKIVLTTSVSGILPVANGGTGLNSIGANGVMFGQGTSVVGTSSNLTWTNSSQQLSVTNGISGIPVNVHAVGNGGAGTVGHVGWYDGVNLVGLLSSADGNEGQFYLLGDINNTNNLGEFACMDRSIVGDRRVAGFQCIGGGGVYTTYLYAKGQYGIAMTSNASVMIYPGNVFGINADPTGMNAQCVVQNSQTYIFSLNSGDDGSTPNDPSTPVGWQHVQTDGNDSWLPYYQ